MSETLLLEVYTQFARRVAVLQRESAVGMKTCVKVLIDLQLGRFQKDMNYEDINITKTQWIMMSARNGQPFLVAIYSKKKC